MKSQTWGMPERLATATEFGGGPDDPIIRGRKIDKAIIKVMQARNPSVAPRGDDDATWRANAERGKKMDVLDEVHVGLAVSNPKLGTGPEWLKLTDLDGVITVSYHRSVTGRFLPSKGCVDVID
ncbi:MAG: hypothetical protein Q9163_004414 [Psora crenata]